MSEVKITVMEETRELTDAEVDAIADALADAILARCQQIMGVGGNNEWSGSRSFGTGRPDLVRAVAGL